MPDMDGLFVPPCWTLDSIPNKGYAPMATLVEGVHTIGRKFTFSGITIIPLDSMYHLLEGPWYVC